MKIKICGLTSIKEAEYLNENAVDFAGFVLFFPKSKRNISIAKAKEIFFALHSSIKKVAVVVSPTLEQVREIEAAGFDYIQIHGSLEDCLLSQINIPVLKAFNIKDMEQYERFQNNPKIAGYVFDALEPGSGKTFDWKLVTNLPRDEKLFLLAGGLQPDNVADAIAAIQPNGVDVSSGVEFVDKPGKDAEKIKRFVTNVRSALS